MANALYDKAKQKFLSGEIDMINDTIKAVLVDGADHTPDTSTDEFLSAIASGARVATTAALTNKSVTNGVFDADDTVFEDVTGDTSELIVIFKDTEDASTSPLIAKIDTVSGGALSVTPNGGDINVQWDNGSDKIFKI